MPSVAQVKVNSSSNSSSKAVSDTFKEEVNAFMVWAKSSDYVARDIVDGSEVKWSSDMLMAFKEPSRNKLLEYVKQLIKEYFICKGNDISDDIKDAKVIMKAFKEAIPVKVNLHTGDTTEGDYIGTLDAVHSIDLVRVFGSPLEFKNENHRFEWKVAVNDRMYSVYDWKQDIDFEQLEWHVCGIHDETDLYETDFKCLQKFIEESKVEIVNDDDLLLEVQAELDEIFEDEIFEDDDINIE